MQLTNLQKLAKILFTVVNQPVLNEDIKSFELEIQLPEQYKELLLFTNGGSFNSNILINNEPYYMTDIFQGFYSIDEILPERHFTIDLIKSENLPIPIDKYCEMLEIGTGGLVRSVIMIGISDSNWGQIFWQCINHDWEYYNYKKVSNSLFEFLELIGKDTLLQS